MHQPISSTSCYSLLIIIPSLQLFWIYLTSSTGGIPCSLNAFFFIYFSQFLFFSTSLQYIMITFRVGCWSMYTTNLSAFLHIVLLWTFSTCHLSINMPQLGSFNYSPLFRSQSLLYRLDWISQSRCTYIAFITVYHCNFVPEQTCVTKYVYRCVQYHIPND